MNAKFNIGDKVEVIHYGHPIFTPKSVIAQDEKIIKEEGDCAWVDIKPEIVGRQGIISGRSKIQGQYSYVIKGIPEKTAWYDEHQLKLLSANPNVAHNNP